MSLRIFATTALVFGLLGNSAVAQSNAEADRKAAERKEEAVRKQEDGLLPPKEALEQADSDIAPDAYQAKGMELGSFLLLPKVEFDLGYNSNIYATKENAISDTIATVRPELSLRSRFDRHSVTGTLRGERKEYRDRSAEDVTNTFAQVTGQYDVTERDTLNASLTHSLDHEDRGSPDAVSGLRPTEFQYLTFNTSGSMNTGRLTSILGFTAVNRQWEDTQTSTGIVPSHFRNRNEYELKLRESYEFIPGYSIIGEGAWITRRYEHEVDNTGYRRDSDGLRLSTGVGIDISDVIRGDVLVGYMRQDYDDARLPTAEGPSIKMMLNWVPTRLTTVIPSIERSIEETTAVGVSALLTTSASVTVRHELRRNVILGSTLTFSTDEQEGGPLSSDTYDALVRATYLFNEYVYTSVELAGRRKSANVDTNSYDRTTGMVRLGLQY